VPSTIRAWDAPARRAAHSRAGDGAGSVDPLRKKGRGISPGQPANQLHAHRRQPGTRSVQGPWPSTSRTEHPSLIARGKCFLDPSGPSRTKQNLRHRSCWQSASLLIRLALHQAHRTPARRADSADRWRTAEASGRSLNKLQDCWGTLSIPPHPPGNFFFFSLVPPFFG